MAGHRIHNLKASMKRNGIDITALIPGNSFFYLTGMRVLLHERPMIILVNANGKSAFLIPALELPSASERLSADEYEFYSYTDETGYEKALLGLSDDLALNRSIIASEFMGMRLFEFDMLKRSAPDASFVDGGYLLEELRMIKDEEEISFLKKASDITDRALDETFRILEPGMTELEIQNEMEIQMLRFGSQEPLKNQIVVSGPRSAFPHSKASERRIREGDMVIIDTGATYNGYPCDLTRTCAVGRIDDEMRNAYEVVKKANAAVVEFSREFSSPTYTAEQLDKAARDVIEAQGYGEYFIHRTGHGLGLGGHEAPFIVKGNTMVMKVGMTFTDEPGIYIPGKGGVRIEDNVVVTEKGLEYLTGYPRDLRII